MKGLPGRLLIPVKTGIQVMNAFLDASVRWHDDRAAHRCRVGAQEMKSSSVNPRDFLSPIVTPHDCTPEHCSAQLRNFIVSPFALARTRRTTIC